MDDNVNPNEIRAAIGNLDELDLSQLVAVDWFGFDELDDFDDEVHGSSCWQYSAPSNQQTPPHVWSAEYPSSLLVLDDFFARDSQDSIEAVENHDEFQLAKVLFWPVARIRFRRRWIGPHQSKPR